MMFVWNLGDSLEPASCVSFSMGSSPSRWFTWPRWGFDSLWNFPSSQVVEGSRHCWQLCLSLFPPGVQAGWPGCCAGSQQAQDHVSQVGLGVRPQPLAVGQVVLPGILARNNQNSNLRIFIEYLLGIRHCSESSWSPWGLKHSGEKGRARPEPRERLPPLPPALSWKVPFHRPPPTAAVPELGPSAEILSPSGSAERVYMRRKSGSGHVFPGADPAAVLSWMVCVDAGLLTP